MAALPRHFWDRHLQILCEDWVRLSRLFDTALREALCALANQCIQLARAALAQHLQADGFDVCSASSGGENLRLAGEQ